MFINEPVLKGSAAKKKPKTMSKSIKEYEFSPSINEKTANTPTRSSPIFSSEKRQRASRISS